MSTCVCLPLHPPRKPYTNHTLSFVTPVIIPWVEPFLYELTFEIGKESIRDYVARVKALVMKLEQTVSVQLKLN